MAMLSACDKPFYGLTTVLSIAAIVYVMVTANMLVAGVTTLLGCVLCVLAFLVQCQLGAAFGCVVMIAGLLVQVLMAPTCGDPGYEVCWKDCILPAPYFNHNALFHALFAVGMLILAIILPGMGSQYTKLQDGGEE